MRGVSLTPAGPGYAAVISTLHGICFGKAVQTPWDEAAVAGLLAMPGAFAFVAHRHKSPMGFVLARRAADEAEIITIGTYPAARRQGVAAALLEQTIETAIKEGARRIFLEVAADNTAALAFYGGHKFTVCGHRKGYYQRPEGPVDAQVLVLEPAVGPNPGT